MKYRIRNILKDFVTFALIIVVTVGVVLLLLGSM